MDYRNADGSLAEMCGNGVRVFARYLAEAGLVARRGGVQPGHPRRAWCRWTIGEEIAVGMAMPRVYVARARPPATAACSAGPAVDVGNPHLVCPVDEPTLERLDLTRAPGIDPLIFPAGVNVEFAAGGGTAGGRRPVPADAGLRARLRRDAVLRIGRVRGGGGRPDHAGLETGVVIVDVAGGRLTITQTAAEFLLAGPAVIVAHGDVDAQAIRQLAPSLSRASGSTLAGRPAQAASTGDGVADGSPSTVLSR